MKRLPPSCPEHLSIVPIELRQRSEDEERALLFAAGRDPVAELDARIVGVCSIVLLLAFIFAALLR